MDRAERFPAGRTKTTLISFFFLCTIEVGCYGQSVQAATPLIRLTDLENFVSSPDDSSMNVAHTVFQQDALQMTESLEFYSLSLHLGSRRLFRSFFNHFEEMMAIAIVRIFQC
ncbi:hypothetical protein TNIN_74201 [Trichonephila inaurata madagascariensis]|uniref:Uncharacterized protein n=1 Tax=Trichonephila inaurata madagascariensis TaxID=2747483 RepID=A0A8X7CC07_9ARAC|nr:hypothetical protein TNIN_74201 [Trichonephila inaurata madagascariensis]